jgi:hypothetical protein
VIHASFQGNFCAKIHLPVVMPATACNQYPRGSRPPGNDKSE